MASSGRSLQLLKCVVQTIREVMQVSRPLSMTQGREAQLTSIAPKSEIQPNAAEYGHPNIRRLRAPVLTGRHRCLRGVEWGVWKSFDLVELCATNTARPRLRAKRGVRRLEVFEGLPYQEGVQEGAQEGVWHARLLSVSARARNAALSAHRPRLPRRTSTLRGRRAAPSRGFGAWTAKAGCRAAARPAKGQHP